LPIGKFVGLLLLNLAIICVSITATYLLVMIGEAGVTLELPRLFAGLLSTSLAACYYGALATAFGAMVISLPFAVMMTYVLVVDIGASYAPGMLKAFSMGSHLLAVAGRYQPQSGFLTSDPELSLAISMPIIIAVSLVWLVIAITWVNSTEYRTDK
jgi:ABC-type transport system involved in multi-copper enzyme maturation permease subunit